MNQYETWITEYVKNPHLTCKETTEQMVAVFPELTRVRGHVYLLSGRYVPHWWLTTADGEIVDPTASQFSGIVMYDPWDESEPEPVGKCMNCGKLFFARQYAPFCDSICLEDYCKEMGLRVKQSEGRE